jgi:diaminopimelate decarboxylase
VGTASSGHSVIPRLQVGDTIAVMDSGAYFVPHQTTFSNPRPAAVLVSAGRASLLRRRESFENVVQLDVL